MTAIVTHQIGVSSAHVEPAEKVPYQHTDPRTLATWLRDTRQTADLEPTSVEHLFVKGIEFLERHLRDRLHIPANERVVVGFDPANTRPRDYCGPVPHSARNQPAHGLPNSVALGDLYPEFKRSGSMKTILLYEDAKLRVQDGWSSLITVTIEHLLDRWCVTSVLIGGGSESAQAAARDLFLPKRVLKSSQMNLHPAYTNALNTEY